MSRRRDKIADRVAAEVTKQFTDRGLLIEAGWAAYSALLLPNETAPGYRDEMRYAFMAGAEHLFMSLMSVLDPGDEPTPADMRRMDLIGAEVMRWRALLEARIQIQKAMGVRGDGKPQ